MALLQNDKAIFYHPLDNSTEFLKSQAWTESTATFSSAKISSGLFGTPGTSVSSFGSQVDFLVGSVYRVRVTALSSTKVVVAYRNGSPNSGRAKVGIVSGTDITFGAEVEFLSTEPEHVAVTAISATKVVVAYGNFSSGSAKVGTVSGTDITFGSAAAFNSGSTPKADVGKLDSSKVVVTYALGTTNGSSKVGTVSGTDITFGSATVFRATKIGPSAIAFLSSTSFAVFSRETAVNGDGYARVGTVSGTDITYGTESLVTTEIGDEWLMDAVGLSATKFVVVYRRPGGPPQEGGAKVGTVSGTAITFGAQAEWSASATTPNNLSVSRINSSQFAISYADSSELGQTKIGTVSGTDVTFGAATEHQGGSGAWYNSVAVLDSSTLVVCYQDRSDTDGSAKVGTLTVAGASLEFGTGMSFGTEKEHSAAGAIDDNAVAMLTSTKFVVCYNDTVTSGGMTYSRVGTVSGTDVTFGAEVELFGSFSDDMVVRAFSATKVIAGYSVSANGRLEVGTVSGTDITWGNAKQINGASDASVIGLAVLDSTKAGVSYKDGSSQGYCVLATVSGTDITLGTANLFDVSLTGYTSATPLTLTKFFIVWGKASAGTGAVVNVVGTNVSYGTAAGFMSGAAPGLTPRALATLDSTHVVVVYTDPGDSSHGTAKVGTISGSNTTWGAEHEFFSGGAATIAVVAAINSTQVVVCYNDNVDSSHGTAKRGTVSGTDITWELETEFNAASTNWIDIDFLSSTTAVVAYKDSGDSGHGTTKAMSLVSDPYDTVAAATKVAFVGWLKNPSA